MLSKRGLLVAAGLAASCLVAGALAGTAAATLVPNSGATPGGSYRAVTPQRVLDTRSGLGGPKGPTQSIAVFTASAGVPAGGVSAVAVTLTVIDPSASGHLTTYVAGTHRPTTSNLSYPAGRTLAVATIATTDSLGRFKIYSSRSTQLTVDVSGYFTTSTTTARGALYVPVPSARLLDTRQLPNRALGPGSVRALRVTGVAGVPATATAVVVNVTATAATTGGHVIAYTSGQPRPEISTVNFARDETRADRAIVAVGTGGTISFYNAYGSTHLVVDIAGYYAPSAPNGSYYVMVRPTRVFDSRVGHVGPLRVRPVPIAGYDGLPRIDAVTPATAIAATITALPEQGLGGGHLSVYAEGAPAPRTSDVSYQPDQATANLALNALGADGGIVLADPTESADEIVDVVGVFERPARTPTPTGTWAWTDSDPIPSSTNAPNDVTAIADMFTAAAVLRADGTVWEWQDAGTGPARRVTMTQVPNLSSVTAIAAGIATGYALVGNTVWAWGANGAGQLGDGTTTSRAAAEPVQGLPADIVAIGAAAETGYAVESNGQLWAWGDNEYGQYGNGTTTGFAPVAIAGAPDFVSISGSDYTTEGVAADGSVYYWGSYSGTNSTPQREYGVCPAVAVLDNKVLCTDGHINGDPDLTSVVALARTAGNPLALRSDGTVWHTGGWDTQVPGLTGISVIGGYADLTYAVA